MSSLLSFTIDRLDAVAAREDLDALGALLCDVVDKGASVGFLPPLSSEAAGQYWSGVVADLASGTRQLLVARSGTGLLGSVQLDLPTKPNASHRGELQKLIVRSTARRQGIATALMAAAESLAGSIGRRLLVLDTRQGDNAERLYRRLGYVEAGSIPGYARSADGSLHTTVIFYKQLAEL